MLIFLYNLIQLATAIIFLPLVPLLLLSSKLRRKIPARLGIRLRSRKNVSSPAPPTFWVHALSVGEVTSAVPLIQGLRDQYPDSDITVTVSTTTGYDVAQDLLGPVADQIIGTPFDILPVVHRYIQKIRPDIYILVETDFWPNLLAAIARAKIPMLLVNGRISARSFASYRQHEWFFRPMFHRFTHFGLQTEEEKEKFRLLGVDPAKLSTLGNLKYHQPSIPARTAALEPFLPKNRLHLVAGSTHPGEEEILLAVYKGLRAKFPHLFLILAPRNPGRAENILELARKIDLHGKRRSHNDTLPGDFLILDTIGELADCYRLGDIGFTGGSLVAAGGHNPIEPARAGVPVLFGPHMEDFLEIAAELILHRGARQVVDRDDLRSALLQLLEDEPLRIDMGRNARESVSLHQGVVANHIQLVERLLA